MSEPLVFSVWIFSLSLSADTYSVPHPKRLSLKHTQNSILLLVSHSSSCDFLPGHSLYSILSLHPPSRAFALSRFLTDETYEPERVIFAIKLGGGQKYRYRPVLTYLLLIVMFRMISSDQGTPLEMKYPPALRQCFGKATRKDPSFISTEKAPPWVITELSPKRRILPVGGLVAASLIYQFSGGLYPPFPSSSRQLLQMIVRYLVETEGPLESARLFTDLRIPTR